MQKQKMKPAWEKLYFAATKAEKQKPVDVASSTGNEGNTEAVVYKTPDKTVACSRKHDHPIKRENVEPVKKEKLATPNNSTSQQSEKKRKIKSHAKSDFNVTQQIKLPLLPEADAHYLITELKAYFPHLNKQLLIREYTRFIYLKAVVSPGSILRASHVIEKMWELHNQKPKMYADFCATNGFDFLHICTMQNVPVNIYQTLILYVNTFVETPEILIWKNGCDADSQDDDDDAIYERKTNSESSRKPIEYYDTHQGIYMQEDLGGPFGCLIRYLGYNPEAAVAQKMVYGAHVYTLSDVMGSVGRELLRHKYVLFYFFVHKN